MNIKATNNIGFKGLIIRKFENDRLSEKYEYSPYSWEISKNGDPIISKPRVIDFGAEYLPDNEKVVGEKLSDNTHEVYDILGKEHPEGGLMQSATMNREESLKVLNSKLERFLELKQKRMTVLAQKVKSASLPPENEEYCRTGSKTCYRDFQQYVNINESIASVKKLIEKNNAEIGLLENAKKDGMLIDVSRRDLDKPNKPLLDAMVDIKGNMRKFIAFPQKTISFGTFLEIFNKRRIYKNESFSERVLRVADAIVAKKV